MRSRNTWIIVVALTACTPPAPPYAGLDQNSYGSLSNNALHYCDPALQGSPPDSAEDQLAKGITGLIAKPFGGALQPDETISQEEMQNFFKMPSDVMRKNVVLLNRDKNGIVFWYILDLVSHNEISAAADFYCRKFDKSAIDQGSAQKCDEAKWTPFVQNGQRVYQHSTFAISSFRCDASGRGSSPARGVRPQRKVTPP